MSTDRFNLNKELSTTLQGGIFAAYDKDAQTNVVVKRASKKLLKSKKSKDDIEIAEDFLNEIKILKYLTKLPDSDSYNFVKYIAEWEDDRFYYYAMDKCYHNLFHIIHDIHVHGKMKQYTKQQAKKNQVVLHHETEFSSFIKSIFQQIVKTVWWLHKNGIAHMDISLENMMISNEKGNRVKIIDFGLAQDISKSTKSRGRVGKIRYMAPEVYNGCKYDCRLADVWCLGICLFMMLAGSPLYHEPNTKDELFKLLIRGKLSLIAKQWKTLRLLSRDSYELLVDVFRPEYARISMDGILDSDFVGLHKWRKEESNKAKSAKANSPKKIGKKKKKKSLKSKIRKVSKFARKILNKKHSNKHN